ncbi:hypothetical protein [Streptomyces sp. DT117]
MRQFEETEEQARLGRELSEVLAEFSDPQGLTELGYDPVRRLFMGARVA